jgi:hypothetical protein
MCSWRRAKLTPAAARHVRGRITTEPAKFHVLRHVPRPRTPACQKIGKHVGFIDPLNRAITPRSTLVGRTVKFMGHNNNDMLFRSFPRLAWHYKLCSIFYI